VDLGARIRQARLAENLSQEGLARRADVSLNVVSRLERGLIEDPHVSTLTRVAEALGLPPWTLVSGKGGVPWPINLRALEMELIQERDFESVDELSEAMRERGAQKLLKQYDNDITELSNLRNTLREERQRIHQIPTPRERVREFSGVLMDFLQQIEIVERALEKVSGGHVNHGPDEEVATEGGGG
jgi:transcriptional regulator with XRE-family HTH domain